MTDRAAAVLPTGAAAGSEPILDSRAQNTWVALLHHRSAQIGIAILLIFVVGTFIGPLLLHNNPSNNWDYQNLNNTFARPSAAHLLGTDQLGRDVLVRLLYGTRYTLLIAVAAVGLAVVIGVPMGAVSAYLGGWVDMSIQRLIDIILAFPTFLLALSLVAVLGTGLRNVIIAVAVTSFPNIVRMLRASALSVREQPYVEAARALGVNRTAIMFRHVIPNSLAPVIVMATLLLGGAILSAAGLGFLGVGVQQPTPEWGGMLGQAQQYIFSDSALITYPGLCIVSAVLAFNLLGDGLRDVLDPRLKR
jgi:peptide/nickel transport system permease protein